MADTLYFTEKKVLHWKKATLVRHLVMGSCAAEKHLCSSSRWCLPSVEFLPCSRVFPFLWFKVLSWKLTQIFPPPLLSNLLPFPLLPFILSNKKLFCFMKCYSNHVQLITPSPPGSWYDNITRDCGLMTSPLLYYTIVTSSGSRSLELDLVLLFLATGDCASHYFCASVSLYVKSGNSNNFLTNKGSLVTAWQMLIWFLLLSQS